MHSGWEEARGEKFAAASRRLLQYLLTAVCGKHKPPYFQIDAAPGPRPHAVEFRRAPHRLVVVLIAMLGLLAGCSFNPETAKRKYVENGNKYFARGKYKEASILYRSALRKDPRYGEAYYRLGLAELQLKNLPSAVRAFLRSVELQPQNEDARAKLADLYLISYSASPLRREEIAREITKLVDQIVKINPGSFDAVRIRGQLALLERDYEGAVTLLEQAEKMRPLEPNVVTAMCLALEKLNQFHRCEHLAQGVIQEHPTFEAIYALLYLEYMRRGRLDEASDILEKKTSNAVQNSKNIIQLAQHYYLIGKRDKAVQSLDRLLANRQLFPNARRLAAEFYLQFGEFEAARVHLREGARTSEGAERLSYEQRIVETLIEEGRLEEARRMLGSLIQQYKSDPGLLALEASIVLSSGTVDEVRNEIRRLEELTRRSPRNPSVRYQLGRAYWLEHREEAAIEQFEEAARLSKEFAAPRMALAQMYLDSRDWASALGFSEEAVRVVPGDPVARSLFALALRGMGRHKEALDQLRTVTRQYPSRPEFWLHLGRLELEMGNGEAAQRVFHECYQAIRSAACLAGDAESLAATGQTTKSLELLDKQLAARPHDRELKLAAAGMFQKLKLYARARALYEELVRADPDSVSPRVGLAAASLALDDPSVALNHLQAAANRDPNNPVVLHYLSVALISLDRRDEALEVCENLLRLRSDDPVVLNNTAYLLAETGGDLQRALTYAQRAVRAVPSERDFSDTLGWVCLKSGLTKQAADVYRSLVASSPDNPLYRYRLALALHQAGDHEKARQEAELALRLKPAPSQLQSVRELLKKLKR
ncbi:MAG: tetratricopeptide repeat protein [Bryobacteraceae bacterium]